VTAAWLPGLLCVVPSFLHPHILPLLTPCSVWLRRCKPWLPSATYRQLQQIDSGLQEQLAELKRQGPQNLAGGELLGFQGRWELGFRAGRQAGSCYYQRVLLEGSLLGTACSHCWRWHPTLDAAQDHHLESSALLCCAHPACHAPCTNHIDLPDTSSVYTAGPL